MVVVPPRRPAQLCTHVHALDVRYKDADSQINVREKKVLRLALYDARACGYSLRQDALRMTGKVATINTTAQENRLCSSGQLRHARAAVLYYYVCERNKAQ